MTKAPNLPLGKVCLQSLWRLFNNLDTASPLRYHVYYHLVQVAKQCEQVRSHLVTYMFQKIQQHYFWPTFIVS